ncbi:thioredoxin peroxidase [Ameyamaea chiangmaiensis NBRC 103196]|uniref:thioredoxin-dependent peroxiredoxin n=1 Tax=Ameyamaea chiangmaiensis TaxID=442969 RepID=A0A850PH30_9PROT|nr:thioredoxin-dependent thiol peroxidase [Ameyamaea chiangmaiensis]MBS4074711.1 thioredoxin-dependent thiol peroxidase [Ameyamaea chiangmaiensis]NVN41959.1 thioredoxin-dependent thiol peroxidase [Ameyamaea chiangmaiensis]GBQ62451.1 thioredoxin peroxidase [Ameyamaea chiangmaiensis NBRC 103196]
MTATHPQVGDAAPPFRLPASHGRTVSSDALSGKPYLLYFYPKADTPGCTTQACSLQEALPSLGKLSLTVIGVSPDPIKAIDRFADKFDLTFPLASDADHTLADAYGTWVEKSMYGRTYWGMERSSFLVDGSGVIRAVWRKVKPAEHTALVAAAAAAL